LNVCTWEQLTKELDLWERDGAVATFWWRDDDAVDDTPQLDLLLRHAGEIPLAIGVVPGLATRSLAEKLAKHESVVVLQHGWRHANHALAGYDEYPASRPTEEVSQEISDGRRFLTALFGPQTIPVFTPPWHGFDACFLPLLRRNGIIGISRMGPRLAAFAAEGVFAANAHMAPIKWSTPPSFGDDDVYIGRVIDHLRGRRLGRYDATEATGLLTHHLVQNEKSYALISRFVEVVSEHPAAAWTGAKDMFALRAAAG
jgi:hypothetical protein